MSQEKVAMQIALVQLDIVWEDKEASHTRARQLLAKANIPAGALIVFPEMFDTGFSMRPDVTCQSADLESESFLRAVAMETQCAVLGGVVGELRGTQASNLAVAFGPDGEPLVRYQKMRPFTPLGEDRHYGAGDQCELFSWQGMRIAPLICYDLRFPELFRMATKEGAELLCVVANWPETRSEHWVRLLQARAIENQAFVIGVNRCGSDPEIRYDGRSCAFDPLGVSLVEADGNEQVLLVDIERQQLVDWRNQFPALRDAGM